MPNLLCSHCLISGIETQAETITGGDALCRDCSRQVHEAAADQQDHLAELAAQVQSRARSGSLPPWVPRG